MLTLNYFVTVLLLSLQVKYTVALSAGLQGSFRDARATGGKCTILIGF